MFSKKYNNKEVFIIGGGSSLKSFDFNKLRDKDTIVINKTIFHTPNANYFITCDNSLSMKLRRENKLRDFKKINIPKFFVVQLALNYLKEEHGKIIDIRSNTIYNLQYFDTIIKSYNLEGIGYNWNDFRCGVDSAYCGLQLAILLGYKEINLLGIDFTITEETHFHEGYGQSKEKFLNRLDWYYDYWKRGLNNLKNNSEIKIYNCSHISKLKEILPYKEI